MADNCSYHKLEPTDDTYANLLLRRRFCKRILILLCVFAASFYLAIYLFQDTKTTKVVSFTSVHRCPACCGVAACSSLYEKFEHIIANPAALGPKPTAYHDFENGKKFEWKYLAEDAVFKKFDKQICTAWGLKPNCKWKELFERFDLNKAIQKILKLVEWEQTPGKEKLLTFCPDARKVLEFLQPGEWIDLDDDSQGLKNNLINLWTMLSINPEPLILRAMPISIDWPLPAFWGCCGRVEVISYDGAPLSSLYGVCWRRKLEIAVNIIKAAMDFTFQDRRYHIYIMDWSAENIVVNELNEVTFTNLNHVVIFDIYALTPFLKQRFDKKREKSWHKNDKHLMKLYDLCTNNISFHNIQKACSLLAGDGGKPFLLDGENVMDVITVKLLEECRNDLQGLNIYKKASTIIDRLKDIVKLGRNGTLNSNIYKKFRYP